MAGLSSKLPELLSSRNKKEKKGEDGAEHFQERHENGKTWMDRMEDLTGRDLDGDGRIGKVQSCFPTSVMSAQFEFHVSSRYRACDRMRVFPGLRQGGCCQ